VDSSPQNEANNCSGRGSIHYRKARHKRKAITAIKRIAKALLGARLIGGKQVINIVPKGAPDKGLAVERERRRQHYDKVIYVGDDETDEHAFAMVRTGRFLTIRVGPKRSSLARFHIRNQKEIDRLLASLIALRTRRGATKRALKAARSTAAPRR